MRRPLLGAALLLSACGTAGPPPPVAAPATVAAVAAPDDGLWITLEADAEHLSPVGHAVHSGWVPIDAVVPDGAVVAPGDELVRFSVETIRLWNDRDQFGINRDAQRRRLDMLQSDGEIARLQSRIGQLRARRAVVAAQLAATDRIDAEQVRIAELRLDDARAAHAAALQRSTRLERIAAAGAPVSGADLARAREDLAQARAGLAAPEVALELARLPAARSTVRLLRLTLADLDAQLGATDADGLAAALQTAIERRNRRQMDVGRGDRQRTFALRSALLQDPVIRATAGGIATLRDEAVRVGGRVANDVNCVFVLDPAGLAARIRIPERQRPLIAVGARATLASPAFASGPVVGSIVAISASPDEGRDLVAGFDATIRLAEAPEGLRPGMSLECRLSVALPEHPVLIPSYCVADPDRPGVLSADGAERRIEGFRAGGWFVVTGGLAVGDRVRVPAGAPAPDRRRSSSLVEPAVFVPVRLRSWSWEMVDMLPEGSVVKAGQRIAGLAKTEHWRPVDQVRSDADANLAQARVDFQVAQLSAADRRAAARTSWVQAVIGLDRARTQAWATRRSYDAVAEAQVAAAVETAGIAQERAERELRAAEAERSAGGISEAQLRDRRNAHLKAVMALERTRLEAAAAEVGRDWLGLAALDGAVVTAAEQEAAQRAQLQIAGEAYRAALAGAQARMEGTRRWIASQLETVADETVTAPADGVLVYARKGGRAPKPGRSLETNEPFRIAVGTERRATFEVPAREFGRRSVGDAIELRAAGLSEPVVGRIVLIANAFLPRSGFADEIALGRTLGPEERIFRVTVSFTPPGGDPAVLPPGSAIHADF